MTSLRVAIVVVLLINIAGCAAAAAYLWLLRRLRLWRGPLDLTYMLAWPWLLWQLAVGPFEHWERRRAHARQMRWEARMEERWKDRI